jgi:hypothetical protein
MNGKRICLSGALALLGGFIAVWVSLACRSDAVLVQPSSLPDADCLQSVIQYRGAQVTLEAPAQRLLVSRRVFLKVYGRDAPSAPLAGVRATHNKCELGVSDDSGVLDLPATATGGGPVVLRRAGYETVAIEFGTGDIEKTRNVILENGSTLHGMVVDQAGRPLSDATITIEKGGLSKGKNAADEMFFDARTGRPACYIARASTDARGHFQCDGLSMGRHTVAVFKTGYVLDTGLGPGFGGRDLDAVGIDIANSKTVVDIRVVAVMATVCEIKLPEGAADEIAECLMWQQKLPKELEPLSGYYAGLLRNQLAAQMGTCPHGVVQSLQFAKVRTGFEAKPVTGSLLVRLAGLKSRRWLAPLAFQPLASEAAPRRTELVLDVAPTLVRIEVASPLAVALQAAEKDCRARFRGKRLEDGKTVFAAPPGYYQIVPEQLALLRGGIKRYQTISATVGSPVEVVADFGPLESKLCRLLIQVVDVLGRPVEGCYVRIGGPSGHATIRSQSTQVEVTCVAGYYAIEIADAAGLVCGKASVHIPEGVSSTIARVQLQYK